MADTFPRSPEEIFDDYFNRRSGILRALTDGKSRDRLQLPRQA